MGTQTTIIIIAINFNQKAENCFDEKIYDT